MASPSDIAAVRHFTRFYTRRTELLSEGLLDSVFSLTEARVLYELAHRQAPMAAGLGRDLGIDPGYLSRILKRFEATGLLRRTQRADDARQAALSLTKAGRDAFGPLDRASAVQVERLLAGLDAGGRAELVGAMGTIERLLGAALAGGSEVVLRPHRVGDIGWIAHRQGLLYAREYGWDETFEALVAEIAAGFVRAHDPARERAWIADRGGDILGSVFLVRESDEVAKLRLLYVEPAARGSGLGVRLVGACTAFAREAGYRAVTLWTNDCLVSARRIYEAEGFRLVEEERHRSFGKDLVGQNWWLDL